MKPLVSCIMPTYNRARFLPAAIDCFLKQTYENKELIILDDSDEHCKTVLSSSWPITNIFTERMSIGAKRNMGCEVAKGEIICHFDSDDFSTPDRISFQVERLAATGKPITGFSNMHFWDYANQRAMIYMTQVDNYVCGTSLCYLKEFWQDNKFEDKTKGEDNSFVMPNLKHIAASEDVGHMVARLHPEKTAGEAIIKTEISKAFLPVEFWENERLVIQ